MLAGQSQYLHRTILDGTCSFDYKQIRYNRHGMAWLAKLRKNNLNSGLFFNYILICLSGVSNLMIKYINKFDDKYSEVNY